jgi:hypothetical protein
MQRMKELQVLCRPGNPDLSGKISGGWEWQFAIKLIRHDDDQGYAVGGYTSGHR